MDTKLFEIPQSSVLVSAVEIMQRRMELRGPGPGSADPCKIRMGDIVECLDLAMSLSMHLSEALVRLEGSTFEPAPTPHRYLAAAMACATKIFTRVADLKDGGDVWDNPHFRKFSFDLSTGVATALLARHAYMTKTDLDRPKVDS